jgi:hypothetical protein
MDTRSKTTWGLVLWIGGKFGLLMALLLSLTGIGACLGIPLALVCVPCIICGVVLYFQGRSETAREVIAAGVRQGIVEAQSHTSAPQAPPYQGAMIASRAQTADAKVPAEPTDVVPLQLTDSIVPGSAAPSPDGDHRDKPDAPDPSSPTAEPLP